MITQIKAHIPVLSAKTWTGLLNLLVIYIVWGSTYLAIRVAVRPGAGFPPFTLASSRVLTAGILLLLLAVLQRERIIPTLKETGLLWLSGNLLWLTGNGLVVWAEQRVDSGLAALLIGSTPIWVAIIEMFLDRKLPSSRLVISLFIGFVGISLLSLPTLSSGVQADVFSVIAILAGTLSWGAGSLLQTRRPVGLSPTASSGFQNLFAGLSLGVLALLNHEPAPIPSADAWWAWAYLVIFGSLAFTSFVRVLHLLPMPVVMTYGYVNPVIAVILGWVILDEKITIWTIAGSALILVGVAGVFRERFRQRKMNGH